MSLEKTSLRALARQDTAAEEDQGDIAVLDFAALLQEIAVARSGREEQSDARAGGVGVEMWLPMFRWASLKSI